MYVWRQKSMNAPRNNFLLVWFQSPGILFCSDFCSQVLLFGRDFFFLQEFWFRRKVFRRYLYFFSRIFFCRDFFAGTFVAGILVRFGLFWRNSWWSRASFSERKRCPHTTVSIKRYEWWHPGHHFDYNRFDVSIVGHQLEVMARPSGLFTVNSLRLEHLELFFWWD